MRYVIDLTLSTEGKTVVKARAEVRDEAGTVVVVGEGKAQSVARAVGVALEPAWDGLVPAAIIAARKALAAGKTEEPTGALPDTAPTFTGLAAV